MCRQMVAGTIPAPRKQRKLYHSPSQRARHSSRALTSATHSPATRDMSPAAARSHGLDNRKVRNDPGQVPQLGDRHPARLQVRGTRGRGRRTGRNLREPHAHDAPTQNRPPQAAVRADALAPPPRPRPLRSCRLAARTGRAAPAGTRASTRAARSGVPGNRRWLRPPRDEAWVLQSVKRSSVYPRSARSTEPELSRSGTRGVSCGRSGERCRLRAGSACTHWRIRSCCREQRDNRHRTAPRAASTAPCARRRLRAHPS